MTKQKNISHDTLREHLMYIANTLADDSKIDTKEKAEIEIERAKAMIDIAKQMTEIDKVEIEEKELLVNAITIANRLDYTLSDVKGLLEDNV